MKRINGKVLNDMLSDIKKMNFISFCNRYVPTYIYSEELQHCIEMYKKTGHRYFLDEVKKEFNIVLFQVMPNNSIFENFAYIIQKDNVDSLSLFLSLYNEYSEFINKDKKEKIAFFTNCSNEVQFRYLKNAPSKQFNNYYHFASNYVQNELFKQSYNPLDHPIPSKLNEDSEKYLKDMINLEYEQSQETLDNGDRSVNTTFLLLYKIIKKAPTEIHIEYLRKFIEQNKELFNNEDIEWSQLEKSYSGECLLELLSNLNIKQKDGEVFHLNFETTYFDAEKFIAVAKKYKISCDLTVRSCNDLPIDIINILQDRLGVEIKTIKFRDYGLSKRQEHPYTLQEYINCRSIIDTIIKDIEIDAGVLGNNDPNREKKICALVMRKIANLTTYNKEYYEKLKENKNTEEEDFWNGSLIGGLLHGQCVCTGYAEILRNVLLSCGIECRYVGSNNVDPEKFGHAWNQVKLDGVWYNVDLTWDADRIVEEKEPKYCLKSDEDFKNHKKYIPICVLAKCTRTEPDIYRYLYRHRISKTINAVNLIRKAIRDRDKDRITLREVDAYENSRNLPITEDKGVEQ